MHLRRHEEEVSSVEQLRTEIVKHGGALRGFFYVATNISPGDVVSDFCRSDTVVRDVVGIPGIFHQPEDFEGHEQDIVFVSDDMQHLGAQIITDEIVSDCSVSVLIRHHLGSAATVDVHRP